MEWETPAWTEIKMDAELSSYVDDLATAADPRAVRAGSRQDSRD